MMQIYYKDYFLPFYFFTFLPFYLFTFHKNHPVYVTPTLTLGSLL